MPTLIDVPVEGDDSEERMTYDESMGNNDTETSLLGDLNELEGRVLPASEPDGTALLGDSTLMDMSMQQENEQDVENRNAGAETLHTDENAPPAAANDTTTLSLSLDASRFGRKPAPATETQSQSQSLDSLSPDRTGTLVGMRKAGPKEEHYKRQHENYVAHLVSNFQHRHPGKLRDYCAMSENDKKREQNRVAGLLSRLGISNARPNLLPSRSRDAAEPGGAHANTSSDSSKTRLDSDPSNNSAEISMDINDASLPPAYSSLDRDKSSEALLSPELEVDRLASQVGRSMALLSAAGDSSDASSVELARGDHRLSSPPVAYESPPPATAVSRAKRLASTSGKKGADISRMRLDDDSFVSFDAAEARASEMITSPSQLLTERIRSPDSMLFPASQSPIRGQDTSWEQSSPDSDTKDRARRDAVEERSMMNDTIQTVDCTVNYRNRMGRHNDSYLAELPVNVQLRDGANFRMKPLSVRRPAAHGPRGERLDRHAGPSQTRFPDPLASYQGKVSEQMHALYDWVEERDELSTEGDTMGGIVFSMSPKQIMDLVVRLTLLLPSVHNDIDVSHDDALLGGTLIVARSKEDLDLWQSALREGTAYSVLNHATMTASERKRTSTASTCCGYDVVVTTFDALKSKDVALPLDDDGHVVTEKIGFQDGWYSSRHAGGNEAPQRCEELSVLHQVVWRRVLFIDVLGRKCFLAKLGTARAVSAAALNSNSRFVFFIDTEDKEPPVKALKKSDRNAFSAVGAALHLPADQAEERLSTDAKIDLRRSLSATSKRQT